MTYWAEKPMASKRDIKLHLLRMAGIHGGSWMDVFFGQSGRVSVDTARKAYAEGRELASSGFICNCRDCTQGNK